MRTHIVLTLTGKDRVGIVEELTQLLFKLGGNVEKSQMARLGGEFAVLMLVSLPSEQLPQLEHNVHSLTNQGYKVTTSRTQAEPAVPQSGYQGFRIQVVGADHEGIIHEIARSLAKRGISVETMETGTQAAPHSGSPLFTMNAQVLVPRELADHDWQTAVEETGRRLNVDVTVTGI